MSDYVYEPDIAENEVTEGAEEIGTNIEDLDVMEVIKRHSDELLSVPVSQGGNDSFPKYMATVNPELLVKKAKQEEEVYEKKGISDLTIKELYSQVSTSFFDIISDLFKIKFDSDFLSNLVKVFSKEDRLFTTGLLLVITALFLVFIKQRK